MSATMVNPVKSASENLDGISHVGTSVDLNPCPDCGRLTYSFVIVDQKKMVFKCSHCGSKKPACEWKNI